MGAKHLQKASWEVVLSEERNEEVIWVVSGRRGDLNLVLQLPALRPGLWVAEGRDSGYHHSCQSFAKQKVGGRG